MNAHFPANTRGIIFDLDGTLYHIKWYMKHLFAFFLFPRWQLLPRYMLLRKAFNGKKTGSGDELLHALAEELAKKSGGHDTEAMYAWILNTFYPAFVKVLASMKGSRPGLNTTLAAVKEKGYRLAVLSDFACIEERLAALDIPAALFDTFLSTESEGALKPCVGPFLEIAKTWHMKPADITVIGDKEETDGIGAARAGMACIKISDKKAPPPGTINWAALRDGLRNLPPLETQHG